MGTHFSNDRQCLDRDILKLLRDSKEPVGAVYLSIALKEKYNVSQSTIGRRLQHMDFEGYTKKVKNTGRILTKEGIELLKYLEDKFMYAKAQEDIMEYLNPSTLKELIDVLVARRGLERESCYLAAINATEEYITKMEEALNEQKRKVYTYGVAGDEENSLFHSLIAEASDNKILQFAIGLLRTQNRFTARLGAVRKLIGGGELYKEHVKILECIKARDPRGAEQAMEEHLNKIIKEFSQFPTLSHTEPKD